MLHGRCLCGSVRFEIDVPLGAVVYCHCSMCRRASGTAFATNASIRTEGFRIVAGEEVIAERESSPNSFRAFCSKCGSPLYGRNSVYPQMRRVRLGTLEDDPGVRPSAHVWVGSKAAWYEIKDDLKQFEREPPVSYLMPG